MKKAKILFILFLAFILASCATQPQVDLKMTDSIFLNPAKKIDKTIYIEVKNTSSIPLDTEKLKNEIENRLISKGYKIYHICKNFEPNYILQLNILYFNKIKNPREELGAIGAIVGGVAGGIAESNSGDTLETLASASLGTHLGYILGSTIGGLTPIETWAGIVDVQIKEKNETVYDHTITLGIIRANTEKKETKIEGNIKIGEKYQTYKTTMIAVIKDMQSKKINKEMVYKMLINTVAKKISEIF